ncbi:uncharacterized protein [Amphiura filiformis]|uniref:uncharacterized protein n=1 Tax=Amphiura filiformis TaxID=82378 RepID=UPI003B2256BE
MALSDIILRRISSNLGSEWEKLASFLGFNQAKVEQFMMETAVRGIENAMFDMLVAWREDQPTRTTNYRKELKTALEKCGRCDLVDIIQEESPKEQLDAIYSSLVCKLDTKPELFEDAISAFYTSYVSITSDSGIAAALINFGQSASKAESKEIDLPTKKWKQHKKIVKRSSEDDDVFFSAIGITLHECGDFAVVDEIEHQEPQASGRGFHLSTQPRVYVFEEDGSQRFVFNSVGAHEKPVGILKLGCDVAVTKQGHYAVTDNTTRVKLFDIKGQNVGSFCISEEGKQENRARCIAVNSNGEIYIGDFTEQVITVHNADDFTILREIYVSIRPSHIAVNSLGQVCVVHTNLFPHNIRHCRVIVFDDSGNEIVSISPTIRGLGVELGFGFGFRSDNTGAAVPLGAVYDRDDSLLLAVYDHSIKNGVMCIDMIRRVNS